jgi:uncharacterized protein with PIN domain
MESHIIIGNSGTSNTEVLSVIKRVLEKQEYSVYQEAVEEVITLTNPYAFLNEKPKPSKSRLKKCAKGLHEFTSEGKVKIDENFYKEKWSCTYCGKNIDRTV